MREERSLSRTEAACMAGVGRGPNGIDELRALSSANGTNNNPERWYTVEQFERDHVIETLEKLEQGVLDDEIWGKIILMEKCKRLAKAYLRRTTVIIDGSSDEYDGITLGFNRFQNPDSDQDSDEIRRKIGDGIIVKVDENGNIKAMARGLAPVIVQGWQTPTSKCISEQLIAQKGHLKTLKDRLKGITDQQRVEKIFDMRLFNLAIEQELGRSEPNAPELLLKTCIRVALVKDIGTNALKTPCWFMIVNLVALDVLRTKLPCLLNNSSVAGTLRLPSRNPSTIFSIPSTTTLNEIYPSQCGKQFVASERLSESLPVLHQIQQLLQLANTLEKTSSQSQQSVSVRRQRSLSCSDSEDLPVEVQKTIHSKKQRSQPKNLTLSSESSSGVSSMDLMKNFEKVEKWRKNSSRFLEKHKEEKDLDDEDLVDVAIPESKPNKSIEMPLPKSHAYRKPLTTGLFVNNNDIKDFPDTGNRENIQCIRISDNEEESLKRAPPPRERFESQNEQLPRDHYVMTSRKQDSSSYGIATVIHDPRQTQPPDQRIKSSSATTKDAYRPSIPVETSRGISQNNSKNYQHSGQISEATTKSSEPAANEKYVDRYAISPREGSDRTWKQDYGDTGSRDTANYSGKSSGHQLSRSEHYLFSELPPVDYPVEDNGIVVSSLGRFDRENVKKKTLNMQPENGSRQRHYLEKVEKGLQEELSSISQYHNVSEETDQRGKKSRFKSIFSFSGKSAKNFGSEISSQNSSHKATDVQPQNLRHPWMPSGSVPEGDSGSQHPRLIRPEPVAHSLPNIVKPKQHRLMTSPQSTKTITSSDSRQTPDIFINPVYAATTTGPTRCEAVDRSRQTAVLMVPRWEAPPMYDASWHSRRNPRIGIAYGGAALISPYPTYPDNGRRSAKAFRRFI